ncbi:MAG: RimK/LysX family protein [Thermodesulfobacteriota bacterium]|nr:RimK/LysX family protein [Thermodesulfobacteriota bacterium]
MPDLGIPAIRAKVDTGAKSSALHAFDVNRMKREGQYYLQFSVRPLRKRSNLIVRCEAMLLEERQICIYRRQS